MKKLKVLVIIFLAINSFAQITNDSNTIGLLYTEPEKVSEGFVLFAPNYSSYAYLIDNCGFVVNQWNFESKGSYSNVYLLPDGSIVRIVTETVDFNNYECIEQRSWEDELLWRYCDNEIEYSFHSDLQYLPNGNFLILSNEAFRASEAILLGVNPNMISNLFYTESVIELKPNGIDEAEIVWQWSMCDHFVQDYDSTKLNFGSVSENFRKIDINLTDYNHFNSVEYNVDLDQIALSNWTGNEIYIIDHSTTIEEAAGSTGGKYGFGGDLLFRWGAPKNYRAEGEKMLIGQHNPQWIPSEFSKFGGKLSVFNNRYGELNNELDNKASGVFILDIDPDKDGVYPLNENGIFLPDEVDYIWQGKFKESNIFSLYMSGVNVLSNGHLLICEGDKGRFVEVDTSGNIIWSYANPKKENSNIIGAPPKIGVYKIKKYSYNYIPQLSNTLCGDTTVENSNELSLLCKDENYPRVAFNSTVTLDSVSFFSETERTDSLSWHFGDDSISTEIQPVHQYKEAGNYEVCLIGYNCYGTDTLCKEITVEQFTSIDLLSNNNVQVYPKLATTQLYIKPLKNHFKKYSIYNLDGKLIASATLAKPIIDINHLQSGIYWLQLHNHTLNKLEVHKFIKP